MASLVSRALIDIGLTPNQVSALSIVFAACAAVALAGSSHLDGGWRIAALVTCAICIQLRLLCNLFDGMMAIEGGQRTPLGDLYNDVPDRIADPVILIAAGVATGKLALGLWLGWLAALLAVLTAYVRVLGAASGAGHDFAGPMAKQHRMAVITLASMLAILEPLWNAQGQIMRVALGVIVLGCVVTIVRRLMRLAAALKPREEEAV